MDLPGRAAELARAEIAAALPKRWRHVQAVGRKAQSVAVFLGEADGAALVAAAWLHDVGYALGVVRTGLHALDGGRWLRDNGWPVRIAALVAHHSCAQFEADERGLGGVLASEFVRERSETADALWWADMTTGPDGQDLTVRDRLAEIRNWYGPDDLVTRFWARAEPAAVEAVERTEKLLAGHPMWLGPVFVSVVDSEPHGRVDVEAVQLIVCDPAHLG